MEAATKPQVVAYFEDQAERTVERALASIADARKELEYIERQLRDAGEGQPYARVGVIHGVHEGDVFSAFAAVEAAAMARRLTA
jgi:hypothetical protein